jgi:hypothetical protein
VLPELNDPYEDGYEFEQYNRLYQIADRDFDYIYKPHPWKTYFCEFEMDEFDLATMIIKS